MNNYEYQTLNDLMPNTLNINIGHTTGTGIVPYEKIVVRNGDKEIIITMEKLFKVLEELFNE